MKCGILILTFKFLLINDPLFAQEILFQDDFESHKADTFPGKPWILRWDGNAPENQTIVNDVSVSGSQSLKLEGAPGWGASAIVMLPQLPPVIFCEGYIMAEKCFYMTLISLYNPEVATWGQQYAGVNICRIGNIYCEDRALQSCERGKWYHIKIKYRSHADLCDVWVDGILKGVNIPCEKKGEYNAFQVAARVEGSSAKGWFDDVKVYADSLTMMIYHFYSGIYLDLTGKTDDAELLIKKALAYPETNKNLLAERYLPVSLLKGVYDHPGTDPDSVLVNKERAYDWYVQQGYLFLATHISNDLGWYYYEKNKLNLAERYYLQSEKIVDEMTRDNVWYRHDTLVNVLSLGTELISPFHSWQMQELIWTMGRSAYHGLYKINEKKELSRKALHYYIAFSKAGEMLYRLQQNRKEIESKTYGNTYQALDDQNAILYLRQQIYFRDYKLNQSIYFLAGLGIIVLLVVLLALVFIRQNKLRNEQQNLLLQQKLLRSQMNPHFIFNCLTSIQNFILDEEPHKASKYLSRFSRLVRNILESSVNEYVSLQQEISTIENYLELQKIRFQDKFEYYIEVDESINPESIYIPPMLAQPFIENSIEHGIRHKEARGNIFIRFTLQDNRVVFEVEDDGVGREKAKEILIRQNKEHKSLATAITSERIQVLNKKLKRKISFHIRDLKDARNQPSGTSVILEIPL